MAVKKVPSIHLSKTGEVIYFLEVIGHHVMGDLSALVVGEQIFSAVLWISGEIFHNIG